MSWFRENRFLGTFLVAFGVCVLAALWFLFSAKSGWDEAGVRFANASAEMNRLERLSPYPSADNLRKMKAHAEDYSSALAKLKDELKRRAAPIAAIAPNEFQSRLRVALNAVSDKARTNKVKLPDKFYLGFDDFVSALPSEAAAPLLGQELVQIEWLLGALLDAHVDAVGSFRRAPLAEEVVTESKVVERNVIELTFFSTPGAARKVINQIAGANQPFCIIRQLHVRNEKEKGPPREGAGETPATALTFIVGNEKIETTAQIEIVRFTL
ncbi:MAG TPA: Amuc_1100 family pilus-like protein [Chthoniobacterales bacterium]|nr:Amuc_1100 family pilus-like protein [Chthoniobacterales bacterium]